MLDGKLVLDEKLVLVGKLVLGWEVGVGWEANWDLHQTMISLKIYVSQLSNDVYTMQM